MYGKVVASGGATAHEFGQAVAISGDTAVVGAHYADVGANADQGAAYVFTRSAGTWTLAAKLTASDGAEYDAFGWSVALSGDTALVGAPNHSESSYSAQGASYLFLKPGGGWVTDTETHQFLPGYGASGAHFGSSVALSDDAALMGAPGDDAARGSAYFYQP